MTRRNAKTMVDEIFNLILTEIIEGKIPPGAAINELAIANKLAVSRGPVREAVKRIEGVGLVVKEPFMKARVVDLTIEKVIEIFQIREGVESISVRLATQIMSDEELDRLLSDFSNAPIDEESADFDLHLRIAGGCGNERIRSYLCDELYYLLRMYRHRSAQAPGRREVARFEHGQILKAMRNRDADLAETLMRNHISRATQSLQKQLAQQNAAQIAASAI